MSTKTFIFDVIVKQFKPSDNKYGQGFTDPNELETTVQFNGKSIGITKSRINVDEFKANTGLQFSGVPKKMRQNLEECGMPVQLKYGGKVVGTGLISLPQAGIDQIDENMSDWIFNGSCNVEMEGNVVGKVEILFRLIIKCDEPKKDDPKSCKNVDEVVRQDDIMFVMADSQRNANPCDPCLDALPPDEGDPLLQLDLERYLGFQEALKSTKIFTHTPAGNAACCEIKKMALECQDIVDNIIKQSGVPVPMKPCRPPPPSTGVCNGSSLDYFPTVENPLTSPNVPCFSYLPTHKEDPADFCSPNFIPVSISDLAKPTIKPIRFCPVCLTDMSWMPKFANCPTCGVKPMPVVEDRHKDKKLTGDDIISEYLGKSKRFSLDYYCEDPCNPPPEEEDEPKCYCTCKFGKLCAHCRIRKEVEDIFRISKNEKVCPKEKPQGSEDFCIQEDDPNQCRPYLARVFSEMRDLYNIKDTKQPTEEDTTPVAKSAPRNQLKDLLVKREKIVKRPLKKVKRDNRHPKPGHERCAEALAPVSHRHGWAWHLAHEARVEGWRPGWVRKSVKRLMRFFLNRQDSPYVLCKKLKETEAERIRKLPTLNLKKKDGVLTVTLRPLNDRNIQMNPISFNIVKSDRAVAASQIKAKLKAKGFPKCTCHQTVMMCNCRCMQDKKRLEYAIAQECRRRNIDNVVDQLVLTDTSEDEMDYDLDLPTAAADDTAVWPPPKKSAKFNHHTQFNKNDLKVTPKYPTKLNPYWRAYDCAAGDRYTGTAFGAPGEEVFEDGVFGFGGGGPHGASAAPGGRPKPPGVWGAGGGGPGGRGGRGGPGGPGGAFGGKGFPGKKPGKGEKRPPAPPIPVRMTDKYYQKADEAEQARKDKIKADIATKKKGINLIEYLENKGSVPKPWDPNNPKPKNQPPKPKGPEVGPDGLTAAQRRRRDLLMGPCPPLDHMPRLGKCPGNCYNPCHGQVCYNCFYNYYC